MKILSLKSVLLYQLGRTLVCDSEANATCFTDFLQKSGKDASNARLCEINKTLDWREIPLKRKQKTPQILYVSPLPQTLAAFNSGAVGVDPSAPTQTIAKRLNQSHSNLKLKRTNEQALCSDQTSSIEAQLWLEFEIETQRPGWLAFCLSEKGFDRWLQHWQTQPHSIAKISIVSQNFRLGAASTAMDDSIAKMLWQAQYTYASCARLLEKERIVKKAAEMAVKKSPLRKNLEQESHSLLFAPTRSLVHTLIDTADSLFWIPYRWPDRQYLMLLKHVMPLCQAFERFHRVCLCELGRPYAVLNSQEVAERSQQWRLVSATKNILKDLLELYLGELAPEQL